MKLLFDQNLSFKLCQALADLFPGSSQVQRAKANAFALVTQDSDFADMAALYGTPPKVIWLRCGNQPTHVIEKLLRDHARQTTSPRPGARKAPADPLS